MSVEANQIKKRFNLLAAVSTWIILAGFITLPNTFTSLQNSNSLRGNKGGELIQDTIRNIKLLPFAIILCCLGLFSIVFLWIKFQANYIWLM
jgi:hypothetical protein